LIPDTDIERALDYIRDSAERYGELVGQCKYLEHKRKVVRSQAFLDATGSSVAQREALAETTPAYREVVKQIQSAETEKATIATLIKGAELKIEVWRSQNAQRRNV